VSDERIISHQTVRLASGAHRSPDDGACVMELASMLAGEPFTDHPRSVCPVVAALLRTCNDRFDEHTRQRLLRYAAESVGTADDAATPQARVARCADVARERAPHRRFARWRGRELTPPAAADGPGMELFLHKVVRALARRPDGIEVLMGLVDDLLAMGRRTTVPAAAIARPAPRAGRAGIA
jgi:hypothetical protein